MPQPARDTGQNLSTHAMAASSLGSGLLAKYSTSVRVQNARNLLVIKRTQHVTTLARFTALRCLSLLGAVELEAEEVRSDQACRT